jgi:hypothetical protein
MKKNQFLDLIKDITDEADIDETILSQGFAKPISDMEGLKNLLASNEQIKGYYQSSLDSGIGKGVAKYKENFMANELPKLIDEGIRSKSNEGKSEIELKYEQSQKEIEQMKAEKSKSELSSKLMKELSDKGLSNEWVDFVIADNEENSIARLEKLNGVLSATTEAKIKQKLGDFTYEAKHTNNTNDDGMTVDKFKKMGYKDRVQLKNTNEQLYKELQEQSTNI